MLLAQLPEELVEGGGGGGVDVGDGLGGDHDPAHRMGRRGDQAADPAAEVRGVGEEQGRVEAVQEQAGDLAGAGVAVDVVVALELVLAAQDGVVGLPARRTKSASDSRMATKMPTSTPSRATPRKAASQRTNSEPRTWYRRRTAATRSARWRR